MIRPSYTEAHLPPAPRRTYTGLCRAVERLRFRLAMADQARRRFEAANPPPLPSTCWTCRHTPGDDTCRSCYAASNWEGVK